MIKHEKKYFVLCGKSQSITLRKFFKNVKTQEITLPHTGWLDYTCIDLNQSLNDTCEVAEHTALFFRFGLVKIMTIQTTWCNSNLSNI